MSNRISIEYFEWLYGLVCGQVRSRSLYRRLLTRLHETRFRYPLTRDKNRAEDGKDLRYRFANLQGYDVPSTIADLGGPCSVLEMMIALAIRCEECIMDDTAYGNRTTQWFWNMITNMGLGPMTDDMFDDTIVNSIIQRFLDRDYEPDGKGGLFRIRDCDVDLRDVEIWYQLCWYLDTIT